MNISSGSGYTRLVSAVVMQAINDYVAPWEQMKGGGKKAEAKKAAVRNMSEEAGRWLMSDDRRAFGFVWCCMVLDVAPDRLRISMGDREHLRGWLRELKSRAPGL